jgi:type II secretory pathway pseudopilin PulG
MYLAGQGARRRPCGSVQKLDDGGFIMVVLLIGMAVSAVWMGAMLPAWRQQTLRQKEAELIFRGEEYARAIALYWRKNNQTLPPSIDVLVSQRYLRKKYLDPITNKEFLPVGGPGQGSGSPGPSTPQLPGGRAAGPALSGAGGQGSLLLGGRAGISGVRSTSTATSIVVYRGQTSYSQFPFDYVTALQRMGAAGAQPGANPATGRGGLRRGSVGRPVPGDEVEPLFPGRGRGVDRSGGNTGPPAGTPGRARGQ